MKRKFEIIIFNLLLVLSGFANGTIRYVQEAIYLNPIHGTNVFVLPGPNASQLIGNCGINRPDLVQHWKPSDKQVLIIDKKIDSQLEDTKSIFQSDKIIKLYFGLQSTIGNKYVYTFIFPSSINEKLTIQFGDDSRVCPELKMIAEFDIDKLKLTLHKPDITNISNGRHKVPHHN